MNERQKKELQAVVSASIDWEVKLERYTSFGIGGPAEAIVTVRHKEELSQILAYLQNEEIDWYILGKGTNVLVSDSGFKGAIILLGGEFTKFVIGSTKKDCVKVTAGSGLSFGRLSLICMEAGLSGLEFGCGIPGTLGGAVIMNAGAWGSDIGSVTEEVTIVTADQEKRFKRNNLNFGYRCWEDFGPYLKKAVVAEVSMTLEKRDPDTIREYCAELREKRKQSQPNLYANAGSFFKNPPSSSAGKLIDSCGLKGCRVGGAMVSPEHGNFLVNTGAATAEDVVRLMRVVQEKVKYETGISLHPEVHFI